MSIQRSLVNKRFSDRSAAPTIECTAVAARGAYVPARNMLESRLIQIWEKVLTRSNIGVADDFFELGGTALQAAVLLIWIEQTFGQRLDQQMIVRERTIVRIATLLGTGGE